MDLNTFIVAFCCLVDDRIKGRRIHQRGPSPKLSDAQVLAVEIVGEFLGVDTDKGVHLFFERHYGEWFPALGKVHRIAFTRQTANLRKVEECLWQELLFLLVPHDDPAFALVDSIPLPACLFAHFLVVPANAHKLSVVPGLVEPTRGLAVVDRNYWSPETREELVESGGVELLVAYWSKKQDPDSRRRVCLSRLRCRFDTVFSQMTGRSRIKRVWARDLWHLLGRMPRKVVSHTVAFLLNWPSR